MLMSGFLDRFQVADNLVANDAKFARVESFVICESDRPQAIFGYPIALYPGLVRHVGSP